MMEAMNGITAAERSLLNPSLDNDTRKQFVDEWQKWEDEFHEGEKLFFSVEKHADEAQLMRNFNEKMEIWERGSDRLVEEAGVISIDDISHAESQLRGRLVDHLRWVEQLEDSVETQTAFTGQLDPTKCGLGLNG